MPPWLPARREPSASDRLHRTVGSSTSDRQDVHCRDYPGRTPSSVLTPLVNTTRVPPAMAGGTLGRDGRPHASRLMSRARSRTGGSKSPAMSSTLGRLLRARRQELEFSITHLAGRLGVTKSYLSMLESGRRQPAEEQFDSLAQALGVPADVLRVAGGRLPPDVSTAVPKNAQAIVTTLRRVDDSARVTFRSDLSAEFRRTVRAASQMSGPPEDLPPFTAALREGKNSQTYRAHSYHTKVPPEAIEKLIRHHTNRGHLVVDPFCGSGMAGVAAIRCERNSVLSDLSTAAVHIAQNYTTPCDASEFVSAANRVLDRVRPTLMWLYESGSASSRSRVEYTVWSDVFQCPNCNEEILYWDGARDTGTGGITGRIRCRRCASDHEKRDLRWVGERPVETNARGAGSRDAHAPTNSELELIQRADASEVLHWIPQVPFTREREMWRAGHAAQGIVSVEAFYTRRNLHALAAIRHAIHAEDNERLRSALMFAFTGMVNRASKRYQWNVKRPTNVMTGTLYVSSLRYEWNVGSLFERKVGDVARYYALLGSPAGRSETIQASATSLPHLPDGCADYVFMDPPFGSNIFYADSSLLWEAWLGTLTDDKSEIVVNKRRSQSSGGKSLSDYQRLMAAAFLQVSRVLKPTAYATLQFNNTSDDVWCAVQEALHEAGLEVRNAVGLDKIHPSIKGVKGRQARESIAALDALIELRKQTAKSSATQRSIATENHVSAAIQEVLNSCSSSFTTDEAFSAVVRSSLVTGRSLQGISMNNVKLHLSRRFPAHDGKWLRSGSKDTTPHASETIESVDSPYGCVVEHCLSTDQELLSILQPSRPAPSVTGDAPRVVSGQRNTALYNAHSYHTKLPPESIVPFIKHFTRPGDVVLDPFSGTGMTGVAAQLTGRRAVLSDLSVAAAHLSFNHTRPCDPSALQAAFDKIAAGLEAEFREIYACSDGRKRGYLHYTLWGRDAICPNCDHRVSIWDHIDQGTGRMPSIIKCPYCKHKTAKHSLKYDGNRPVLLSYVGSDGMRHERAPVPADLKLISQQAEIAPATWFPSIEVDQSREMYIRSALHLQGIRNVSDFYMPRNLRALSSLWASIQQVEDGRVKAALSFAFTNTAWHGTRMRRFNARGGQRPLTGTLYIPQLSSEANVLEVMRNKIRQLRSYFDALGTQESPLPAVLLSSATRLGRIPNESIDYAFTDPPFGSNLFYSDCNLIWEAWLGGFTSPTEEVVVNRSRGASQGGKSVEDYQRLMTESMQEIYRVLKPEAWATLVFHNTDPAIWRAIQSAAAVAGFQIESAGGLDRRQQSHKGYKGRAEVEDVAHFDVIMSMRRSHSATLRPSRHLSRPRLERIIRDTASSLTPEQRTIQRVHSEVIQTLARSRQDLGAVGFEAVRAVMEQARRGRRAPNRETAADRTSKRKGSRS